uniref:small ribosomal subunit protein eS10-like n=1 Tax=Myxine glutinosa TaxID=7769 RepID=UPI00358E1BB0
MVAGMLMPTEVLRSVHERLFRDGVMVTRRERRPSSHPDVPGASQLQVWRVMESMRSRGFVRLTVAWQHRYWYLTGSGLLFLRQRLHLPPEILPATMRRILPAPPRPVPTKRPTVLRASPDDRSGYRHLGTGRSKVSDQELRIPPKQRENVHCGTAGPLNTHMPGVLYIGLH